MSCPFPEPPSPPRTPSNHRADVSEPSAPGSAASTHAHCPPTPMSSPPSSVTTTAPPATAAAAMARLHPHAQPASSAPSVRCLVRTRIPTRFGSDVYVHLYHNSLDNKEHLALVFGPHIRSRTLDEPHAESETPADRLTRGASVADPAGVSTGPRVHPRHASRTVGLTPTTGKDEGQNGLDVPPLVRLHSECFTGETISSVRCDCGDQLDEAMRLMSMEGNGVIVYLRQEGRGIGLLEKLRAYNLQDQGHDTVTANLLLNHPADLRTYDVASLILADLGVHQVRLLTNNPDKMEQIAQVGIRVVDRVGMVPTHWTAGGGSPPRPHGLAHILSGKPHAGLAGGPCCNAEHMSEPRMSSSHKRQVAMRSLVSDEAECGFDSQNERTFTPSPPTTRHHACCNPPCSPLPLPPPPPRHTHHGPNDDDASSLSDWEEGSSSSERPPAPSAPRHASDSRLNSTTTSPAPPGRPSSSSRLHASSPLAAPVFPEMEAYLRTKVERMRHMIDLSASPVAGMSASSLMGGEGEGEGSGSEGVEEDAPVATPANGETARGRAAPLVLDARHQEALQVVSPRPVAATKAGPSGAPAFAPVGVTYGG